LLLTPALSGPMLHEHVYWLRLVEEVLPAAILVVPHGIEAGDRRDRHGRIYPRANTTVVGHQQEIVVQLELLLLERARQLALSGALRHDNPLHLKEPLPTCKPNDAIHGLTRHPQLQTRKRDPQTSALRAETCRSCGAKVWTGVRKALHP